MQSKAKFKRHPQAIALDKWLETEEGKKVLSNSILRHSRDVYYLENRIKSAFAAGWNAKEREENHERLSRERAEAIQLAGEINKAHLETQSKVAALEGEVANWKTVDGHVEKLEGEIIALEARLAEAEGLLENVGQFLNHSGNQRAILSGKFVTPSARYDWFTEIKKEIAVYLARRTGGEGK